MPAKVYSKLQKEEVNIKLLETALYMFSKYGIKNVKLMDVVKSVGISKPFFYTFYDSVQEFVICVLDYQWMKFPSFLDKVETQTHLSWEEKVYLVLKEVTYYNKTGFLIMTQEEEIWVRKRIDDKEYDNFMKKQTKSFEDILMRWGVSTSKCDSKVFANMFLSMILIHNSAKQSLPFLYLDRLDETAQAHARGIIEYLKPLRDEV